MSSEPSNTPTPERYDSELSYLQDEIRWVEIRCRRIATDLKLARGRDEFSRKPQWGFDQEEPPSVLEDRSESLKQREDELRAHIDACRALHEQDGEPLALDKLCALYELDAFERNVLLLASAPVFSRKFDEIYGTINMDGYGAACLNVGRRGATCRQLAQAHLRAADRCCAATLAPVSPATCSPAAAASSRE